MTSSAESERSYWQTSALERPGAWSNELLTLKMSEARVLLEKIRAFAVVLDGASTIVELGAGQGWASCIVRAERPEATVIATELAPEALATTGRWVDVVGAAPSGAIGALATAVPLADGSADVVFAFAAAHHFDDMPSVLAEIERVLRPGGRALFFHEPSSPRWINGPAVRRVNAKRPAVPENVLVYSDVVDAAAACGLECTLHFAPTTTARGPVETLYYLMVSRSRRLQRTLPCTIDYEFRKP